MDGAHRGSSAKILGHHGSSGTIFGSSGVIGQHNGLSGVMGHHFWLIGAPGWSSANFLAHWGSGHNFWLMGGCLLTFSFIGYNFWLIGSHLGSSVNILGHRAPFLANRGSSGVIVHFPEKILILSANILGLLLGIIFLLIGGHRPTLWVIRGHWASFFFSSGIIFCSLGLLPQHDS